MTTPPVVAVVDDDPRIRDLLAAELEDLGATVLCCPDGQALLAQTELKRVALVLLDWMMPGLNGAATLAALSQRQFQGRVVVVTALCDPAVQSCAAAAGASAVLLKTDVLEQLPALLNQA